MLRGMTVALGVGLICLWLSELGMTTGVAPWMTWLDLVAGLLTFGIAAAMRPPISRGVHGGGPISLSLIIFALGLVTLSSAAPPWQAWWNFFFAGALFLVGLGTLIDVDGQTFSLPWHEPRRYNDSSPTGFGHGFLYPHDSRYPPQAIGEERDRGRAPRHYTRSDQRIEEDIYDWLSHGWELDASEIRVSVKGGEVTLSGLVDSRRSRRWAEEIADNVLGVKDIHNDLAIHSSQRSETGGKENTSAVRAVAHPRT